MHYVKFLSYYLLHRYPRFRIFKKKKKEKKFCENLKMPRTASVLSRSLLHLVCASVSRLHY